MVGCHHQLNGLESEQAPGDGEGQGSLECHSVLILHHSQEWKSIQPGQQFNAIHNF